MFEMTICCILEIAAGGFCGCGVKRDAGGAERGECGSTPRDCGILALQTQMLLFKEYQILN